jgi:hypothetical protein
VCQHGPPVPEATQLVRTRAAPDGALRLFLAALATFLVWRGSLYLFDFLGLNLTPRMGRCREQWEVFGGEHYFWNGFFRWDAGWYRQIVLRGYRFRPDGPSSSAFYPLIPYLSRYLGYLLGNPFVAGLVVANTATIGTIFYLRRIGRLLFNDEVGKLAVILCLLFPSSLFLTAFYSEGLFVCLSVAACFYYLRDQYVWCGVLGFFAMLTRSTGMVLFLALSLDLAVRLLRRQARFRPSMLALLLIPLGLLTFMAILQHQVGEPLAFGKAVAHWGRENAWPWATLAQVFRTTNWAFPRNFQNVQALLDAGFAIAFLVIGVWMALRKERVLLWSFVLIGTLLPLSSSNIASTNRYVLSLFPAFFWLARVCQGRPQLERYCIFASSFFLCIYSLRFMQCGWAG